jgi:predicted AAA+ superfamily ATPase
MYLTNFENFVRRLYEEGFKFFITGSSATLLSKELGTNNKLKKGAIFGEKNKKIYTHKKN